MRRKSSPFFLLLFEALFFLLLQNSHSSSVPFLPSIRQKETRAPDFNVLASDDGVPELEPGENPAKDPLIIQDIPTPSNNPDHDGFPHFTASQTDQPKPEGPSKSKISNPPEEPAVEVQEETDFFGDNSFETPDDDSLFDVNPSSEFEEEQFSPSAQTNKKPGKGGDDNPLQPEPSALPGAPPSFSPPVTSTSSAHTKPGAKDTKAPTSSKGSSPRKPKNSATSNPSANDIPIKKKPIDDSSNTKIDDDHDEELEPSPQDADEEDSTSLPESTPLDDSGSPVLPTAVAPPSKPQVAVPETSTPSDAPELSGTEVKPTPEVSATNSVSNPRADDDSIDPSSGGFVGPNATYQCINFATRSFGEYRQFDKRDADGGYTVYKGSGVALNPTLPMPYRYHVYGKNWTYHLNVTSDLNQNIVLGFAEVFPKACASGRNGSFRVFTVMVGDDFQIIDVMKSSGCGTLQQAVFPNIQPKNQVIDLNFDAISGKAMLSVICYGASDHAVQGGTSKISPNGGTSESGKNSGSLPDTANKVKKCFEFGKSEISGFTSITVPELASGVEVYKDETASVVNTASPDVYKSHIFGEKFKLSIAVGVTHAVTVQLGFAEIFEPGCSLGFRVFTVKAGLELRTIDVFKEAGCNSALILELHNVQPNASGEIDIDFTSVSNFPMISTVCILDSSKEKGSPGLNESPSLVISSGPQESEGSEVVGGESNNNGVDSASDSTLPSEESFPEESFQAEVDEVEEGDELELPQTSPYPKENGILIVDSPTTESDRDEKPTSSPFPKVNGLIDATLTNSPSPPGDPESDTEADNNDSTGNNQSAPEPSDELLPSDFSQTTIGEEGSGKDHVPSPDLLVSPSGPSSSSQGASGLESASMTPSLKPSDTPDLGFETGDELDVIAPTKTPVPAAGSSVSDDGGSDSVVNKQGDIVIEAPSPSPSLLTVVIEAPTPSISPVSVTIEGSSPPSSAEEVTIIGSGTGATSTPTPSSISVAAFSPLPSTGVTAPSPSIPSADTPPSDVTPQPVVTAAVPNTVSVEPTVALSPSPLVTPSSAGADSSLPPADSNPTGVPSPQGSTSSDVPDGTVILPPVATSPGPQGDPDGSSGGQGALVSPPPVATISQNQIIVIPTTNAVASPTPVSASPLPQSINSPDPIGIGPGIGAPDGGIAGSVAPDPSTANPAGSPIPDVVTNPSASVESSAEATPSPPLTTSSVGSNEVIVDSTTTEPSPSPIVSTSIGAPDDGPVQVTDNTTEIIQVTGDVGSDGSETEKEPSILVGEYKDIIATTPAGSGFAIGMGILGSLLVVLLLVCLFFAIFRGGGAAYSYSSGYSSHKPTDYDPSQGRYTDDLVLDPTGYGNTPSRGQNTQDGYGTDPVTFESRQEGQSESFGFEMPAAGGLGAPTEEDVRNEEPDTLAEYSSLHLQQPTTYDEPGAELAGNRGNVRGAEAGQSLSSDRYQFTGVEDTYTEERKPDTTYGSNPDEYTFTGTFTIPRTDFRPSQGDRGRDDSQMGGMSQDTEQYLQTNPMTLDSFNDDHSIARPTNASESSGKQERDSRDVSGVLQQSSITNEKAQANASSSREGILVDDVRSSLLDSEYESTASMNSLRSNPIPAASPYETQFNDEVLAPSSGRMERDHTVYRGPDGVAKTSQRSPLQQTTDSYQERISPTPRYQTKQSIESPGEMHYASSEAVGRFALNTSSASNDGPWPSWWSREDHKYQQRSGYETHDTEYAAQENGKLGTDSSFLGSHGLREVEPNGRMVRQTSHSTANPTGFHTKVTETSSGLQGAFVSDSKWRRQYSSTSDEDGSQAEGESQAQVDPYLEELRRRREPYVRSVASRLSTGSGLLMTGSGESAFEKGISRFQVADIGPGTLRQTQEMNNWISRDPVPV